MDFTEEAKAINRQLLEAGDRQERIDIIANALANAAHEDALSRLTAQPLQDEIALTIADVEEVIREGLETPNLSRRDNLRKAVCLLRALALENERLHAQIDTVSETYNEVAREGNHRSRRIRELEASVSEACERIREWKDKCDAIRLKTIEECAEIAAKLYGRGRDLPAIIRALGQSERGAVDAPQP